MLIDIEAKVAEVAYEYPWSMRIFDRLGIEYIGRNSTRSLREAALASGIDEVALRDTIRVTSPGSEPDRDWHGIRPAELVDHILARHHEFTRTELARLEPLVDRLVSLYGETLPELIVVRQLFCQIRDDLLPHMQREEMLLFPLIRALDRGLFDASTGPARAVRVPMQSMCREHEGAVRLFAELRCVTALYSIPDDGCLTWRAVMHGLADLEQDVLEHTYLEDDILFPAVSRLQKATLAIGA
jgi:regulator of cell morphogenesis and NO signaling